MKPSVEIRRAATRFVTEGDGVLARHSFSFGVHYDPGNVGFGVLAAFNDIVVQPGAGFPSHRHRDVEIVTWVVDGALTHTDTTGVEGVIVPGVVQRLSAGRGVEHSERHDRPDDPRPLRFVQMWLPPDESGVEPSYQNSDVGDALSGGGLVVVASGLRRDGDDAVRLGQRAAAMQVARPRAEGSVMLPGAPFVHVFMASGAVDIEGVGRLEDGDAVRLTDDDGRAVRSVTGAELIVWEMYAAASRGGTR